MNTLRSAALTAALVLALAACGANTLPATPIHTVATQDSGGSMPGSPTPQDSGGSMPGILALKITITSVKPLPKAPKMQKGPN